MSMVFLVTCIFRLFEALNGVFEVNFFLGFILHLIKDIDGIEGHVTQILF